MISVTVGARSRSCSGPKPKIVSFRSFFSVRRMRYLRSSWCRCGRTRWKMSLKRVSTRCDLLAHVAALGQVQPLADELQQAVQLGLALGHQRGRHVELVARSARPGRSTPRVPVSMMSWLTRWSRSVRPVISSSSASFSGPKTFSSRQTSSMLFSKQQDALRVAAAVGLELVEVQPLQQLAVDPQLQVGHDRAEVGLQLGAGDRWPPSPPRR